MQMQRTGMWTHGHMDTVEIRLLQRKLTMNEECFHQGQTSFASEPGCWNE